MAKVTFISQRKVTADMKLRLSRWINLDEMDTPIFGVEANARRGLWVPIANGSGPLLFPSKEAATAWIKGPRRYG